MSNEFKITGTIHKIYQTQQVTATFSKREFVLFMKNGDYPQYIRFELKQDKCNLLDSLKENQEVEVYFNVEGREWQGKFFTNLSAWRIVTAGNPKGAIQTAIPAPQTLASELAANDDLPF